MVAREAPGNCEKAIYEATRDGGGKANEEDGQQGKGDQGDHQARTDTAARFPSTSAYIAGTGLALAREGTQAGLIGSR